MATAKPVNNIHSIAVLESLDESEEAADEITPPVESEADQP
jgi:hypothetical protein